MAPERPDEHRDLDGTDPSESTTAAWERFGPARDDLGNELDPNWKDWFHSEPDPSDGGPVPFTTGRKPHVGGADTADGGPRRLGARWRRIGIPYFVAWLILVGLTSGGCQIIDVARARAQGTPGTFELEECRYKRPRRQYGLYHCAASFTGTDGQVLPHVKVLVEESPEEGGTTRTGWIRGDTGWGDDIRLRSRILQHLGGLVLLLVVAGFVIRADRKRREPGLPPDDSGWS
jgi:hypothetical protein